MTLGESMLDHLWVQVSLKFAIRELSEGAIRMGPRVLTENIVGPVVPGVTQPRGSRLQHSWI